MYASFFKRFFDIIISLAVLILLSPVFIVIAIAVRIRHGSPVLFCQERPGKDGKIFKMYKFRTMTNERDENGNLLPDEKRLTKFGQALRSTSLDELPEFFNVLKGDMSFIGPRPLLVSYLPLYSERQKKRHDVRPGITGLAQSSGRNLLAWEDRFEKDVEYVENLSFSMDIKIVFSTISGIIKKEGITSENSVTMEPFLGNKTVSSK
ncbi:MAG: sugar transferase [Clostridia bacterium]|nr:sugar transferase [Clostridia bacterium]